MVFFALPFAFIPSRSISWCDRISVLLCFCCSFGDSLSTTVLLCFMSVGEVCAVYSLRYIEFVPQSRMEFAAIISLGVPATRAVNDQIAT